jgi:hypothetical protein
MHQRYVLKHGRPVLHSAAPSAREDALIQQVVGELSANSHAIDVLVRDNARVLESALGTERTQIVVSKLALSAAERMFEAGVRIGEVARA